MMSSQDQIRLNSFSPDRFMMYLLAIGLVAALTGLMYLIGRDTLGEGVIALLYLVPISWSTARWGQGPGIAAAISAALTFNFFFIPPFYTLYIGRLEGWLLLGIFLVVAIVIVGRVQSGLSMAQEREREAIFMYELSRALAPLRTPESVIHTLAAQIQQLYQARLVQVTIQLEGNASPLYIRVPADVHLLEDPARVLPIMVGPAMVGEIQIWAGEMELPPVENRLLQNFAIQGALTLQRAQLEQIKV
jgi:K+-sensing histidine kinase KdpD